jgi:hypothetical protein
MLLTGLTHKEYTSTKIPAPEKHNSQIGTILNYNRKKFYIISPGKLCHDNQHGDIQHMTLSIMAHSISTNKTQHTAQ